MRFSLLVLACVSIAARAARPAWATAPRHCESVAEGSSVGSDIQSSAAIARDLARERALVDESKAALKASDYEKARAKAGESIAALLARPAAEQDGAWLNLLDSAAGAAWEAQDAHAAGQAWQRVLEVRSRALPDDHPDIQRARLSLAATLRVRGNLAEARELFERVLAIRVRTLPDDHPDLALARTQLANILYEQGDLSGARALYERVLETDLRTLPDDHADLSAVRANLALTLQTQGDLAGARALQEKVLEVFSRTLSDSHPNLQKARLNLAATLFELGDLPAARALQEKVLEVRLRILPADHPDLAAVRGNLANTLRDQGDLPAARALQEKVLEVRSRTLPEDHPDVAAARVNLAATLHDLGEAPAARALVEQALESYARTLPEDHPDLQLARLNLANILCGEGDLPAARALQERVLEVLSRTLPDSHPDLAGARMSLGLTLQAQGDLKAAHALQEKVLEVRSRTLPEDHPDLAAARANLANTLYEQGDLAGARELQEKVLEIDTRTLPDDHSDLAKARLNLSITLFDQGDVQSARALQEKVLEIFSRTLPADHPDLQAARATLATTLETEGDLPAARELAEKVLEVLSRTLPHDHRDLQFARKNLAFTLLVEEARRPKAEGSDETAMEEAKKRCAGLVLASCRAQTDAARAVLASSPGREAEERCAALGKSVDTAISFARGYGVFAPSPELEAAAFELSETTRGAALAAAKLGRRAAGAPRYAELRKALADASDELAVLARKGTTSEAFDLARVKRERAERELIGAARELSGGSLGGADAGVASLARKLEKGSAAIAFRRFTEWRLERSEKVDPSGRPSIRTVGTSRMGAFVVRGGSTDAAGDAGPLLKLVDLGPTAAIERAVGTWREAIGVGRERGLAAGSSDADAARSRGEELRTLVFDPLLATLGDARRVVVVLDDVLHLVPLEALPLPGSPDSLGDRWRIETRAALSELLDARPEVQGVALVALGGASFNVQPLGFSAEEVAALDAAGAAPEPTQVAALLRGGAWERGFEPLTHSADEARGIGALYQEVYEEVRPAVVLEKRKASRQALEELAPKARFVHIATHGWFAPESIKSWSDPEPLDKLTGLGARPSGAEQVRGMSPMLLCGLAFAGANLPENAVGRVPGLVTAEEISTLDLTNCELVVLSACDTNVGEMRAGQGVASLQKALQMAGAASVITSLWKVPDEATKDLMLDFYRRLWVEKKPKWQALWEAKRKIRNEKDENGKPRYSTRDWAAWVLTGDPELSDR